MTKIVSLNLEHDITRKSKTPISKSFVKTKKAKKINKKVQLAINNYYINVDHIADIMKEY